MISGIFGKTKPINYVLLLGLLFLLYGFVSIYSEKELLDTVNFAQQVFALVILLFSVLVVDFVVNRNQISSTNSYVALFFVLLAFLFPAAITDLDAIGCNFFLILASRRLISLRSLRTMKLKILDATLWVLVASLFYSWALIFLLLVFISIYIYEPKNVKNWFVPIAGIVAFLLIWKAVLILYGKEDFFAGHYSFHIGEWEGILRNWSLNIKLIIFVLAITITGLAVFFKSGKLGLGRIINLRVFSIYLTLSLIVFILCLADRDFPILITFFPAAVFLGKYAEMIKRDNVKDLVLTGSVLSVFLIFVIEILIK